MNFNHGNIQLGNDDGTLIMQKQDEFPKYPASVDVNLPPAGKVPSKERRTRSKENSQDWSGPSQGSLTW